MFEPLEMRALLTDVCGHITEDTTWDNTSEPYRVTCALVVDSGVTLTVASGVQVTQTSRCDVTVDGSVLLAPDAKWDAGSEADITVNGNWTMQAGAGVQVSYRAALIVNAGGGLTATDAAWVKLQTSWGAPGGSGLVVKGTATLTNTPVLENGNEFAYLDVYSGGRLTISNGNVQVDRFEYKAGSSGWIDGGNDGTTPITVYGENVTVANLSSAGQVTLGAAGQSLTNSTVAGVWLGTLTPPVTGNTITGTNPLAVRADYYAYVRDHNTITSPAGSTVTITGGTVNADVTWGGLAGVSTYAVVGPLAVESGRTLTVGNGMQVTQTQDCDVTVDGSVLLAPDVKWYAGGKADISLNGNWAMQAGAGIQVAWQAALAVNVGGTLTATDAAWVKLATYGGAPPSTEQVLWSRGRQH